MYTITHHQSLIAGIAPDFNTRSSQPLKVKVYKMSSCDVPSGTDMLRRAVSIVEVSPRDGLQNEQVRFTTEQKVELIVRAAEAGLRRIEVASFVDPQRVPQMADGEAVVAALPRQSNLSYIGLLYGDRKSVV